MFSEKDSYDLVVGGVWVKSLKAIEVTLEDPEKDSNFLFGGGGAECPGVLVKGCCPNKNFTLWLGQRR